MARRLTLGVLLRAGGAAVARAWLHGDHIGRFMEELLSGTLPWAKLRQAQKLLRLGTKYGWLRVDLACRRALAFELINVRRVESILLQDLDQLSLPLEATTDSKVIPLRPRFQRPAGSFTHPPAKEIDHD